LTFIDDELENLEKFKGVFPLELCEPSQNRQRKAEKRIGVVLWVVLAGLAGFYLLALFGL